METAQAQVEAQKKAAAERALDLVRSGTIVGLGTGTTAHYFIDGLAVLVRDGLRIQTVVTSVESRQRAIAGGIPIVDRIDGSIDLTVDGADEIDPGVNCIKGRGGALLREKIVAHASRRFVLIADESKLVGQLGRGPVPVEVLPFLWEATGGAIEALGGRPQLRMRDRRPFKTDNDNLILDTTFASVDAQLAVALHAIPGVLEHGIFFGMAKGAIVGGANGIRLLGDLK